MVRASEFRAPRDRADARVGYDFIFHLGGTGRGPLRMERLAHKVRLHA